VCSQNCTLWQSFGFGGGLWGFGNPDKSGQVVCNVGRVSFFLFCGGRKKQNKFGSAEHQFVPVPSNLHCPVKKALSFLILILS
jgi:hypothetical protein